MKREITTPERQKGYILLVVLVVVAIGISSFYILTTNHATSRPVEVEGTVLLVGLANSSALIDVIETTDGVYALDLYKEQREEWGKVFNYDERRLKVRGYPSNRRWKIVQHGEQIVVDEIVVTSFQLLD